MKRIAFLFALLAFAGLAAAPVHAGCTVASAKGRFSFLASGTSAANGFCATVGYVVFDGLGGFTASDVRSCDGSADHFNDSGTYTMRADCTGTSVTASGFTYYFTLFNNNRSAYIVSVSSGETVTGRADK